LIANNVIEHAEVKYVAVAPEGKEVEELTGKEILQALRKAVPVSDYLRGNGNGFSSKEKEDRTENAEVSFGGDVKQRLREVYKEKLEGTKGALLLDGSLDVIRKVGKAEVASAVKGSRTKVAALILDGTATSSLIRLCDEQGIQYFAATNFASTEDARVKLVSL